MQRNDVRVQAAVWPGGGFRAILASMLINLKTVLLGLMVLLASAAALHQSGAPHANPPEYTSDGQMKFPEHYREWVYLTSGIDMSYNPKAQAADHSMFDNVFVSPEAFKAFQETGTWPDKTVLVLEARVAQNRGSINQRGHFQGSEVMGVEVHVKDEARFAGKWAFFPFDNSPTAKMIATNMDCYSCHS